MKSLFEEVANLRAQQEFAAFETARITKARLTDQQRARLASMMPGELHQIAMSHMTAHEMTQMMEFMGRDGAMMGSGMMGSGMMGSGMMGSGMMGSGMMGSGMMGMPGMKAMPGMKDMPSEGKPEKP